jgi:IS30 family transposase
MYGKNLTLEQRQTIERLYAEDVSVYRIAEAIGVTAATVYRDLKRGATGELDNNLNRRIAPSSRKCALGNP